MSSRADGKAVSQQVALGLEQEPGTGAGGSLVFTAAPVLAVLWQILPAFSLPLFLLLSGLFTAEQLLGGAVPSGKPGILFPPWLLSPVFFQGATLKGFVFQIKQVWAGSFITSIVWIGEFCS